MEGSKKFRTKGKDIAMIKAVLDGYEHVALLSVLDGKSGLIELSYPLGTEETVLHILKSLRDEGIGLEEAEDV
jgi:hypothetical protein